MVADGGSKRRGVAHHPTVEQMLRFRALSADDKLRWLEQMRQFLIRTLPEDRREIMQRFRRGDI